jgi:hypothetical protein
VGISRDDRSCGLPAEQPKGGNEARAMFIEIYN